MKFADDLTLEVPGYDYGDTSMIEVSNIREWPERNRMQLNMEKTYEMVMHIPYLLLFQILIANRG